MSKMRNKKRPPKRVLALPDREPSKVAVLNRLTSKSGQRTYDRAITDFVEWYCSERARPSTALQNLSGTEAKRSDDHQPPGGRPSDGWLLRQLIRRVKGVRRMGVRVGNWLTAEQGKRLLAGADRNSLRGKRNYAILATLIGCGLRRGYACRLPYIPPTTISDVPCYCRNATTRRSPPSSKCGCRCHRQQPPLRFDTQRSAVSADAEQVSEVTAPCHSTENVWTATAKSILKKLSSLWLKSGYLRRNC